MGAAPARTFALQVSKLHRPCGRRAGIPLDFSSKEPRLGLLPATLLSPLEWRFLAEGRSGSDLATLTSAAGCNYFALRSLYTRHESQLASAENARRVLLVDTLALVRRLESQGFTANQAEAITAAMTDVLSDSLGNVVQSFVSKFELQRHDMINEAALSKLKSTMHDSQETKLSLIQREIEKLRIDIDKLRSEMRYEVDKVTAGQRLDLNLERGRMQEELATQNAETSDLTNKLDKEIDAVKTQLEASKYEVIKYCIGTIVSVLALGLGLLRIFK